MGNTAIDVDPVKPGPRTVGFRRGVQQCSRIQKRQVGNTRVVKRDALRGSAGRTNAPDVHFIWWKAVDEVNERAISGPQRKMIVNSAISHIDLFPYFFV